MVKDRETIKTVETTRNYGIDLLKIISMFMVVILHVLGRGGVLYNTSVGSVQFYVAWFLEIAAYCAVNCFAITTGYLMVNKSAEYRKFIKLWVIVEFYNLLFFLINVFIFNSGITILQLKTFSPILSKEYWYFTAYFCLFLFIPFLNKLIDSLSKKSFIILLATGFLWFSVAFIISQYRDAFDLAEGYSAWWLIYLYLVGAGIKKHGFFIKISCIKALIGYALAVLLTFFFKIISVSSVVSGFGVIGHLIAKYSDRFISYISPTILISAVFFTLFCLKLKISKTIGNILKRISLLTFQVYIIHQYYLIWNNIIYNRFVGFATKNPLMMILLVIGSALVIFTVCLLIDWIRSYIFKFLKINALIDILADKLNSLYNKSILKQKIIAFLNEEEL